MNTRKIIALVAIFAALLLTAAVPIAWAAAKPQPFLPPTTPRAGVVLVHCGKDVTAGQSRGLALVRRGGHHFDLVVKGAQSGPGIVARCRIVVPARVTE